MFELRICIAVGALIVLASNLVGSPFVSGETKRDEQSDPQVMCEAEVTVLKSAEEIRCDGSGGARIRVKQKQA